jgi:dsDNA-specific endonuclease/ATPase MutS2
MNEFLDITFRLKEDELLAIDKQIPMTQELFDYCCDRLSEIGAENQFFKLLAEYPDFMVARAKQIERKLEINDFEVPEMTDKELEQRLKKLMEKIEKESGF